MPLKGQKVRFHLLLRRKAQYKTERCLISIQNRRKWAVLKLGGFYSWPNFGPLDAGPISPSPLKPIELGEIGPESNGPSEH